MVSHLHSRHRKTYAHGLVLILLYIMRGNNIYSYVFIFSMKSKFLYVAYPKKIRKIFPKKMATLRGVAGQTPIFLAKIKVC